MKNRKLVFFIVLAITLAMAYTAMYGLLIPIGVYNLVIPGASGIRFGIDIRGGVDAVYEPANLDRKPTLSELEAARAIIETRLDNHNILDRDVTVDEVNGDVLVRFPWKADETNFNPETALAELGETAMLTFRDSQGNILLDGIHVEESGVQLDEETHEYVVALKFDDEGARIFSDVTGRMIGQPISIYMDETLIQTATVEEQIPSGQGVINGMDGFDEAKSLSDKINSGALPFSMVTRNHSTISPLLGSDALSIMVKAGAIAFCIICALMIFYYRLSGLVASISLLIQISGQILVISISQLTLTLTGIAGVILTIGMGVDANVIISERISDEIKSGKTVRSAILAGFKNAFSSVFDGNITVLIVSFVLMIFGSGALLSFAYSLFIGIIFNFIAGVSASRLMIWSLSSFKFLGKPTLYTCLSRRVSYEQNQ